MASTSGRLGKLSPDSRELIFGAHISRDEAAGAAHGTIQSGTADSGKLSYKPSVNIGRNVSVEEEDDDENEVMEIDSAGHMKKNDLPQDEMGHTDAITPANMPSAPNGSGSAKKQPRRSSKSSKSSTSSKSPPPLSPKSRVATHNQQSPSSQPSLHPNPAGSSTPQLAENPQSQDNAFNASNASNAGDPMPQSPQNADSKQKQQTEVGGCQICHRDDDHANLLLCEACNDEYHTYCLNPPLLSVPEGDFFCVKCKHIHSTKDDDGLDSLVSALPPGYTARFGEIVWAAGGVGFGWWPACIYDPRLTVGGARQLARKHLGKKHLVYFFECNDAPFTVLGDPKLSKWEDGFVEEYDLGRVARSGGKARSMCFERALHLAMIENGRPMDLRMDWNHQGVNAVTLPKSAKASNSNKGSFMSQSENRQSSSTQQGSGSKKNKVSSPTYPGSKKHKSSSPSSSSSGNNNLFAEAPQSTGHDVHQKNLSPSSMQRVASSSSFPVNDVILPPPKKQHQNRAKVNRKNLNSAVQALSASNKQANPIEPLEDGRLVCKILRRHFLSSNTPMPVLTPGSVFTADGVEYSNNVGFVTLPSRQTATFACIRRAIETDFDDDCFPLSASKGNQENKGKKWKFYVPKLGPVSNKQEEKIGPVLEFLRGTTNDVQLGNGTPSNPLKIVIMDW